ncbi:MAG: HD domain-containing protein [Pseudomonadota bacterium]
MENEATQRNEKRARDLGVREPIFAKIWGLAKPYLNTRKNELHTEISMGFAHELLEKEGGDQDIVIPAIILHDVGWKEVPEPLQLKAFGPRIEAPELNRRHEVEGSKIAKDILERINYDGDKIKEIIQIIDGHDSRKEPISLNDRIVKDADKLWRYSKEGLLIDAERFKLTHKKEFHRLLSHLHTWFLSDSAREIAEKELANRLKELEGE